jgi:protein XagA
VGIGHSILKASALGLVAASAAFAPRAAEAGAWTAPQGQGLVIETLYGWGGAGAPYGGPASPQEYKINAQTYLEYGLTDGLTAVGVLALEHYELSAPSSDAFTGLDYSGGGLRARLWANDAWVFSLEASAYVSSATDARRPAQAGNTGPEADMRALVGHNLTLFGMPAFLDAEAGYRVRTEGPPDEWRGDLTLGIDWATRWRLIAQSFNTVSAGAGAPGFAAWESHIGQVSLVYALDDKWSLQFGGFGTLYRRNTNTEYGGLVAVWRRF